MKSNFRTWSAILCTALSVAAAANAADLVWIGSTGNWNAAGNWSPAQVPGPADNAFITNSGTPYTVTVPDSVNPTVGSLTLGGASGTQTLSLGRSILTLNGASVVHPNGQLVLTVGNSTVTGAGDLTVNGTLNWASGTMSGSGVTSIGSAGVVVINGGVTLTTRTLNNSGHASWDSANFTAGSGAVINNLSGGTFDLTFDGRLNVGTAPATFNNAGLFRKTAGAATANLILPFNNTGTVNVQSGTLSLENGGTHTGTFNPAAGAVAQFGGGNHVLAASSFVTGTGAVAVSGGATTLTASGKFDVGAKFNGTAGVTTLSATCNVTGATVGVSGGVLNFNSAGVVGVMNLSGGTLGGTSPITVTGPLSLSGGSITNALVTANGGLSITGGVTLNGGKLINPGLAIWSAGNFTGANGAVFSNLFGATFINSFDGNAPSGAGATPLWVNDGVFQKTNGTAALGTTSIDFHFLNTGTVEVRTNTLRYAINQQTAGLTVLSGGNLTAQGQPIQLLGGSLVGTGLVTVANVQNVINSAAISPGLSPGELDIAGNYQQTASGALNIELGGYSPGTEFDLVTVTAGGAGGVATLDGALNVTLTNVFSPTNGATFTFLTANSRIGAFATFNYPSNDIGLQVSYDLTSAKVTVSNLKPVVASPIVSPPPITYGAAFNFQFPANTFSDPDNNTLTYTASGMPAGIGFAGATQTFSGMPTQAGVFPVAVAATDSGTPSLSVTNMITITVSPADITGSFTASDKVYDGTTNATVLTRTLNGVLVGDTNNVSLGGGTANFGNATAGAGKTVTLTGATLTGSAATNYNLISVGTTTAAITARGITGSFTAADKVYDGTTNATVLTRTLNGVLTGDTNNVSLTGGTAGFVNATVGAGKVVTLTGATLTGSAATNYNLTSMGTTTAAITAPAPMLLPLTVADTTNVIITWSAVSNALYRVQSKSDLNTINWTDLVGDVMASGSLASKTDTKTATNRFYRVQVLP